jgi:flagellar export protein FliJ
MQSFRFRLERVADWYTRQYEEEHRRFSACMATLADARQAIVALQAERLSIERDLLERKAIASSDLAALGLYRLGAKKREAELNGVRQRCEQAVQAQRVKLQAAERKVRLLEKLRERRLAEYNYAETRELEELASDAYFAKWAAR